MAAFQASKVVSQLLAKVAAAPSEDSDARTFASPGLVAEAPKSSTLHSSPKDPEPRFEKGRSREAGVIAAWFTAALIELAEAAALAIVISWLTARQVLAEVVMRQQNCSKMDFEHCLFESFELSLSGLLY